MSPLSLVEAKLTVSYRCRLFVVMSLVVVGALLPTALVAGCDVADIELTVSLGAAVVHLAPCAGMALVPNRDGSETPGNRPSSFAFITNGTR